jgi:4-hydroxy-3-polyprenylbenzoate decarboxylase
MQRIVLAVTGASGVIYGIRTLEELSRAGCIIHLIVSESARTILSHETDRSVDDLAALADQCIEEDDIAAAVASGSSRYDAAVIVPCSLKTLAGIAHGYASNVIIRMAMVSLKEGRPLVVVPRETPLDLVSLKNMVRVRQAGAIVLPAMPGFYHLPGQMDDLIDHVVGKILDQLGIEHELFKRWG